jgi:hypothetical protein
MEYLSAASLPLSVGAASAAASGLGGFNVYNSAVSTVDGLGYKAAGNYTQLGVSYALAQFPLSAGALYVAPMLLGQQSMDMKSLLLQAGVSSALFGLLCSMQVDKSLMGAMGLPANNIQTASGPNPYKLIAVALLAGGSVAAAGMLSPFLAQLI